MNAEVGIDVRAELDGWLRELGLMTKDIEALAGDVSVRSYYRVELADGRRLIAAHHPPAIRDALDRFLSSTRLLQAADVPVPTIEAADPARGLLLLADLGDRTLYDVVGTLDEGEREGLFDEALRTALELIARIQNNVSAKACAALNPPLDRELLARELDQTWEVFLERHLQLDRATGFGRALDAWLNQQIDCLAESPFVPCHRDFMARNILPGDPTRGARQVLYVIDHQDLRLGPATYDVASLFNDSVYPPVALVERLIEEAPLAIDRPMYLRSVVQRGLKIIGTFHRFAERGRPRYLGLVPPTLERVYRAMQDLATGDDDLASTLAREARQATAGLADLDWYS